MLTVVKQDNMRVGGQLQNSFAFLVSLSFALLSVSICLSLGHRFLLCLHGDHVLDKIIGEVEASAARTMLLAVIF